MINGGVSGSLTGDWVELWHRVGGSIDPDVVPLRDGSTLRTIPDFFATRTWAHATARREARPR